MAIADTDLLFYGSADMPDDDSNLEIGGAIDETVKIEFTDIDAAGAVEAVSSDGGDTSQTITLYGRNEAGELISSAKTMNGVTPVDFDGTFERLLKVTLSGVGAGTITVRKDGDAGDLMVLEAGITEIRRIFYSALAEESGGSERKYYEKIFAKNAHGTLTLTSAVITENADPSGKCAFDLESSLDGTDTNGAGNNRQVAPGGYSFDSAAKNVANSQNLSAGSAQGIWMELTLAAGTAPAKTSVTMRLTGNST